MRQAVPGTAGPSPVLHPLVAGDSMVPVAHRVARRRRETHDTATLTLVPGGSALAVPAPGQFMMAWVPGVGEIPVSVAALAPGGAGLCLTVRSVGAVSAAVAGSAEGAVLGLRGPFGRAWTLPDPHEPVVVVAGGLGLAPLRMLVEHLVATPDRADTSLVIGARSPEEIVYRDLLEDWSTRSHLSVTVDRPSPGWDGHVGLVTAHLARLRLDPATRAAVCGPEIMMRLVARDLVAAGVGPEAVEVSLERSMSCAVAHCGRCQIGPVMVCRDGAVMPWTTAEALMEVRRW